MNCKYYRIRTDKGIKFGYCLKDKKKVCLFCKECKEYRNTIEEKLKVSNNKPLKSNNHQIKKKPIKGRKHKLTKATEIPKKIKLIVWERDEHKCIFCNTAVTWYYANSHFIKRSHSGLGIEQNIMTNCERCHKLFEESPKREEMKKIARNHFKSKYDNWKEEDLIYKKY